MKSKVLLLTQLFSLSWHLKVVVEAWMSERVSHHHLCPFIAARRRSHQLRRRSPGAPHSSSSSFKREKERPRKSFCWLPFKHVCSYGRKFPWDDTSLVPVLLLQMQVKVFTNTCVLSERKQTEKIFTSAQSCKFMIIIPQRRIIGYIFVNCIIP